MSRMRASRARSSSSSRKSSTAAAASASEPSSASSLIPVSVAAARAEAAPQGHAVRLGGRRGVERPRRRRLPVDDERRRGRRRAPSGGRRRSDRRPPRSRSGRSRGRARRPRTCAGARVAQVSIACAATSVAAASARAQQRLAHAVEAVVGLVDVRLLGGEIRVRHRPVRAYKYATDICVLPILTGMRHRRHSRSRSRRLVRPGHWHVHARVERYVEPSLLLLLRERPLHGYELLERIPELGVEGRVDIGNLYRLLRVARGRGAGALRVERRAPRPAKRTYELTDEGRACSTAGPRRCAARSRRSEHFSSGTRHRLRCRPQDARARPVRPSE